VNERKPPKEFGGTSADGLANERAIDKLDMPFAQSITPRAHARSFKGMGRRRPVLKSVTVFEDTVDDAVNKFVLAGAVGPYSVTGNYNRTVYKASKTNSPFKKTPLTVGDDGFGASQFTLITVGSDLKLLSLGFEMINTPVALTEQTEVRASKNFGAQADEITVRVPPSVSTDTNWHGSTERSYLSRVVRSTELTGAATSFNVLTSVVTSGVSPYHVVPRVLLRNDDRAVRNGSARWVTPSMPTPVSGHDFIVSPPIQLLPYLTIFTATPLPQGVGTNPLMKFLLSDDNSQSYYEVDFSYTLTGGSRAYTATGAGTVPSVDDILQPGGNFSMAALANKYFISLVAPVNSGATYVLEHRLYAGADPFALTRLNSPPNFRVSESYPDGVTGTTTTGWSWLYPGPIIVDAQHGRIGFCVSNADVRATNNAFYSSSNLGTTWTKYPIPWPNFRYGAIRQPTDGTLEVNVSEQVESTHDNIALYRSTDFGATWRRVSTLIRNIPRSEDPYNPFAVLRPFLNLTSYQTGIGSFPSEGSESYRYDYRVPPPTFIVNP
jgi:hypothetical protein